MKALTIYLYYTIVIPFVINPRKEVIHGENNIVQGGSLDSYYEKTLDYVHSKYHGSSSAPNKHRGSSHYEKLAKSISKRANPDASVPMGKQVF